MCLSKNDILLVGGLNPRPFLPKDEEVSDSNHPPGGRLPDIGREGASPPKIRTWFALQSNNIVQIVCDFGMLA